jgi:hypothetical protein
MYQTDPRCLPKDVLPTMYHLPSENPEESGLPDDFQLSILGCAGAMRQAIGYRLLWNKKPSAQNA